MDEELRQKMVEKYGELPYPCDWYAAQCAWQTYRCAIGADNSSAIWKSLPTPEKDAWLRVVLEVKRAYRVRPMIRPPE